MAAIDVVVVAYRSAGYLRGAVEPLCTEGDLNVVVVDNDCPERSPQTLDGLPVEIVEMRRNVGFGAGCNAGAARGSAGAILFLNPDARMSPADVRALAERLARDPDLGAVGPRMTDGDGTMHLTMRREPRLGSAFGEALLLHRAFPRASWTTEIVRDGYDAEHEAEWLGGAVLCVRRSAFERIGGFDERFFMYCEDIDLGKRLRESGYRLLYEPAARSVHLGGGSTPGSQNSALRAKARVTYAALHEQLPRYLAFRLATALAELTRMPLATGDDALLRERAEALRIALTWNPREWLNRAPHPALSGPAVERR